MTETEGGGKEEGGETVGTRDSANAGAHTGTHLKDSTALFSSETGCFSPHHGLT